MIKITPRVTSALLKKRAHKYAIKHAEKHGGYSTAKEFYKWKASKRGPKKAGKYVRPPFPVSKLKAYRKFNWS